MRIATRARGTGRSGFTLIESMVSLSIFSVLGYGLAVAIDVGNDSQRTVGRIAAEDRALREATHLLVDELRSTSDTTITVTALADGNHQLRFMQPIEVAGNNDWGVYDRTLGPDAASQNKAGWRVQYTVRNQVAANGTVNKQLLRQVLDEALVVQREKVLADGLRSGGDVPPGFSVVPQGDMWELSFSTQGEVAGTTGIREVFHVHARN